MEQRAARRHPARCQFRPRRDRRAEGFHWLGEILQRDPQAVVVMITAHAGINVAVDAMKRGATDFVSKPWSNERLLATVRTAAALRTSRAEVATERKKVEAIAAPAAGGETPLLGASPAMARVWSLIERAGPTDANVLILGENGTGKELVARELHRRSRRADQVLVSVDLGAVAENLFESELFGHVKGAFTDARADRIGRMQAADKRHALPRRDRQHAAPPAAQIADRARAAPGRPRRRQPARADRRPRDRRDQLPDRPAFRRNPLPPGPAFPPEHGRDRPAALARAPRGHSRNSPTISSANMRRNTASPRATCPPTSPPRSPPMIGPATSARFAMPASAP